MALPDRYLRHAPAGTTGATDLFATNHPLGAGRVDLLAHNAKLILTRNASRPLCQPERLVGVYLARLTGSTGDPIPADVTWTTTTATTNRRLGTFYCHRDAASLNQRIVVSYRWAVRVGATVGVIILLTPGREPPSAALLWSGQLHAGAGVATFATARLTLVATDAELTAARLAPIDGAATDLPAEEPGVYEFTVHLGTFNSTKNNAAPDLASFYGISARLEPAT